MYEPLLFVHSWVRWVVVIATLYFFIKAAWGWKRRSEWSPSDRSFAWAYSQLFGMQLALGITLWLFVSPVTRAGFIGFARLANEPILLFWTLIHPLSMLTAFGVLQVGEARAKASTNKFRTYTLTIGLVIFIVTAAIPWPWLPHGRTLMRAF